MTSIEKLSEQLIVLESNIKQVERDYRDSIMIVKGFESVLKSAKRERNMHYKEWVNLRKHHKSLKSKIASLPSRVRKWGKDNPGKLLNSLER